MQKALLAIGLTVVMAAALLAAKADFQTGKLLDVTTETRLVDRSSYQWAMFVVQVDDLVYTLRGAHLGRIHQSLITLAVTKSGDNGRDLIVGDPIEVSTHDDDMILRKPNGKELKTKVIKRTRASNNSGNH